MKLFSAIGLLALPLIVSAATLRLEDDRAWLKAEGAPLPKVLELFDQRGVDVLIDPSLELNRISGEWENTKIDRLIAQLVSPNSYLLEWKRIDSPLGELYQISSIKIFSDGNISAAKPLSSGSKILDVVEGINGVSYIRGEIMVGFSEAADIDDLKALLRKLGGTVIEVIDPPGLYRIKLAEKMSVEEAMKIALAHKGVEGVEPNLAFPAMDNQIIPLTGGGQGINLHLQPGETAVAVFDSGLDPQYANLSYIRGMYNAIDPSAEMSDPTGHGTLVALVASGAITPLGAEESGLGVPVLAVRVFDENGFTSSDTIMRAIQYALNSDVEIINLSFGTYEDIGFIEDAVNYAAQQGIQVIVAAGNDGLDKSVNPAANPSTFSVGAKNPDGSVADYSNTGDTVSDYEYGDVKLDGQVHRGTSFASPRIAHKFAIEK
jgi:thermitase